MGIDFYYHPASPPCRHVMLVAAALDLKLNLREVNTMAGDHMNPDFLKINPQHTIPTIVDDGFSLWESRAIGRYLANKYGRESNLYPADLQARALVDQRLDFDLGTLYQNFATYFYPTVLGKAKPDEALFKKLDDALKFLNTFLEGQKYVVGANLTLADLALVATVSTIDSVGISLASYPNVVRWLELMKSTAPGYETNQRGLDAFKDLLDQIKGH